MKKSEEVIQLEKLLNGVEQKQKKTSKSNLDEIIDNAAGIKETEYRSNIPLEEWAGLMVPTKIKTICEYIKSVMQEKAIYSTALDFGIYSAAVQYVMYNEMVIKMCDPDCPMTSKARPSEILGVAEALRKALRELSITLGKCDRHGNNNLHDHNDPIADLLKNMAEDEEEEIIVKSK